MVELRTIDELGDLAGKNVVVRADLDVPMENGEITSNFRVRKAAKTIKELMDKGARVIVVAHLGRPENESEDEFSLMPVRFELGKILEAHIKFAHLASCKNSITFMEDGEVLLLENIRFNASETSENSNERALLFEELGSICDYYVNDAFAAHRPHASNYELPKMFDAPVAGRQLVLELEKLSVLSLEPEKPYVAVIGGAKLDTKIELLERLTEQADYILIGGAMAYTFLKSQGVEVGNSMVEDKMLPVAKRILTLAKKNKCEILLPVDHICGREFAQDTERVEVDTQQIPAGLVGMDIGERTLADYQEVIKSAKTIMWNGPMGVFEWNNFSRGTEAVGEYIALSAPSDTYKVAGGGDTISAMEKLKINFKNFSHVSTGGGAMLKFLSGESFPTIELLTK